MMLHRHFETERNREGMTTLADLNKSESRDEFVSEVFPPEEEKTEQTKRGRKKKNEE